MRKDRIDFALQGIFMKKVIRQAIVILLTAALLAVPAAAFAEENSEGGVHMETADTENAGAEAGGLFFLPAFPV